MHKGLGELPDQVLDGDCDHDVVRMIRAMRFGIVVNAGDPRVMAQLADEAEAAAWDGIIYHDAIAIGDAEM